MIRYILLGILFIIGMYALIFHRSVIKKVIAYGHSEHIDRPSVHHKRIFNR